MLLPACSLLCATPKTLHGLSINGAHLRFTPESVSGYESKGRQTIYRGVHPLNVFVGEQARVFGKLGHHTSIVTVDSLVLTAPTATQVSGLGIIDLLPPPASSSQAPGTTVIRADGRLLTITSKTALTFAPPLLAGPPLHTNQWIRYHAEQQADGAVLVSDAEIRENVISTKEDNLRQKQEYDPATVDPDSHQSTASRLLRGVDIKQIPPWPDEAMQARVNRIGAMLIPRYLTEAPKTWWLLAAKPSKPLAQVALPPRAEYLYLELGTAWRSTVSPTFHLDAPLSPAS